MQLPVRRVLVADDHPDSVEITKLILAEYGHEVFGTCDGADALRIAERDLPDVVFADLLLPSLNGFEIARTLRKQAAFDNTVLFAMTGLATIDCIDNAADAGFDYFVKKPIGDNVLERGVFAPRQESLIILSQELLEYSDLLRIRGTALSAKAEAARQRSIEIIRKYF